MYIYIIHNIICNEIRRYRERDTDEQIQRKRKEEEATKACREYSRRYKGAEWGLN